MSHCITTWDVENSWFNRKWGLGDGPSPPVPSQLGPTINTQSDREPSEFTGWDSGASLPSWSQSKGHVHRERSIPTAFASPKPLDPGGTGVPGHFVGGRLQWTQVLGKAGHLPAPIPHAGALAPAPSRTARRCIGAALFSTCQSLSA